MTGAVRHEVRREEIFAADGTRLALYRVGSTGAMPVLLLPGTFSNHTFWLGTKGHGMAWAAADAGFESVVLDPRGHGASERCGGRGWNLEQWGRLDVTAAIEAITADADAVLLVGHSAGGAAMLMALGGEPATRRSVAGLVLLATPLPWLQGWRPMEARLIRSVSRLLGRFPARLLRLGPEDEIPGVMTQWMAWNLQGAWLGDEGLDYVAALTEVDVPVLGISGAGDRRFAPPAGCRTPVELVGGSDRRYIEAGVSTGFAEDFDHPGIVVSRGAEREVWPLVIRWLREHSSGAAEDLPVS